MKGGVKLNVLKCQQAAIIPHGKVPVERKHSPRKLRPTSPSFRFHCEKAIGHGTQSTKQPIAKSPGAREFIRWDVLADLARNPGPGTQWEN